MSDELIFILSVFSGIPIFLIGWTMSIIAAKRLNALWVLGMVFALPVTLPILALVHWQRAKLPLFVSSIGSALILTAWYYFEQYNA
jgi:hypothetical protein